MFACNEWYMDSPFTAVTQKGKGGFNVRRIRNPSVATVAFPLAGQNSLQPFTHKAAL